MIRAGLTPMSPRTEFAVAWLLEYQEVYAEKNPNSQESFIHVSMRVNVYHTYKEFCTNCNEEPISYTAFSEIWNLALPDLVARPWVSIPGKCHTCAAIDQIQKSPNSKEAVQTACKNAHLLHSAGMIKLERQR